MTCGVKSGPLCSIFWPRATRFNMNKAAMFVLFYVFFRGEFCMKLIITTTDSSKKTNLKYGTEISLNRGKWMSKLLITSHSKIVLLVDNYILLSKSYHVTCLYYQLVLNTILFDKILLTPNVTICTAFEPSVLSLRFS